MGWLYETIPWEAIVFITFLLAVTICLTRNEGRICFDSQSGDTVHGDGRRQAGDASVFRHI